MSLSGILTPNNYTVYCGTIDAQNIIYKDTRYDNGTLAGSYQGAILPGGTQIADIDFDLYGNICTISFSSLDVNGSGTASVVVLSNMIPEQYRPNFVNKYFPFFCVNNGASAIGCVTIDVDGTILFGPGTNGAIPSSLLTFSGTGAMGWNDFSITYSK